MRTSSTPSLVCFVLAGLILTSSPILQAQEKLITPFMTLDWTFSTENLTGEFAVERILDLGIGPQGELVIYDDHEIEVLSEEGYPLHILRDPTAGTIPSRIFHQIGPSGYLTIVGHGRPVLGYLISPEFICTRTFEYPYPAPWTDLLAEHDLNMRDYPLSNITLSEDIRVFTVDGIKSRPRRQRNSPTERWQALLLQNRDTYHLIGAYREVGNISTGPSTGLTVPHFGRLLYQALPDGRIVFTHGGHDRTLSDEGAAYTLRVYSVENGTETTITQAYEPVPIDVEELIRNMLSIRGGEFDPEDPENRTHYNAFYDAVENAPYLAPVCELQTDGSLIFALTNNRLEDGGHLVHVFNAETGCLQCSSVLPWPQDREWRFCRISNGYGYAISSWNRVDGPPVIERYRINPAIYGR